MSTTINLLYFGFHIIFPFASPPKRSPFNLRNYSYKATMSRSSSKQLVRIDITSDTVCPWCFVGKKNLDKAIEASKDQYDFEIKWHPYQLDPKAPKKGVEKKEFYANKFGPQSLRMEARMAEVYRNLGLEYSLAGLTGNTLDSHRLVYFAGQQSPQKQHDLVEEIFIGYFTQGKYVGDREFLLECAGKAGVEGAAEFLQDPINGVNEVEEELSRDSANITGVPFFLINDGKRKLSGAQPPEVFLKAFKP